MKILDNIVTDFDFPGTFDEAIEKEVEFLECFLSENSQLVFRELGSNLYPKLNSEITGVDEKIKRIVLENTILKTKDNLFDLYYESDEDYYWFSPKTKDELIEIVKDNYSFYTCIVLKKGEILQNYDYLLDVEENFKERENSDCRALIIEERIEKSFKTNIQPKVENIFKHIIK